MERFAKISYPNNPIYSYNSNEVECWSNKCFDVDSNSFRFLTYDNILVQYILYKHIEFTFLHLHINILNVFWFRIVLMQGLVLDDFEFVHTSTKYSITDLMSLWRVGVSTNFKQIIKLIKRLPLKYRWRYLSRSSQ